MVPDTRSSNLSLLARFEWIVAIFLSAVVVFLLIARMAHAGPLDRDECDALHLARMPRFSDLLENLKYTAFPILFPASVRAYTSLFGASDIILRYFGLAVGVLMLGAAWFHARSVNREVPLLLPALVGLNLNFLTTGAWVRGYGLGSVLAIFAFIFTERLLLQPSWKRLAATFLSYLAAMHTLFFNGALVPAISLSGALVLLTNREWKWMCLLLGSAGVGVLSYIPYLIKIFSNVRKWAMLMRSPVSLPMMWPRFLEACGGEHLAVSLLWLGVALIAMASAIVWLAFGKKLNRRDRSLLIFGSIAIPVCTLACFVFMRVMRNPVQERYYLALTSLIAAAADLLVANLSPRYWIRLGRVGLVAAAIVALPYVEWTKIVERQSDIDIVAARIEKDAGPNDLIVVNPWWFGISFGHYYRGTNHWITVPEISDHRIHRYDLLQAKMIEFFPLTDVENEIATTLKAGNRVWLVGEVVWNGHSPPMVLAPAPDPQYGWMYHAYTAAWSQELGYLIQNHAEKLDVVLNKQPSVRAFENITLFVSEGWQY